MGLREWVRERRLLPTPEDRAEQRMMRELGEYNLAACRVLDAHHQAVDEAADSGCATGGEVTGTCSICPYAGGWRVVNGVDGFRHYTNASVGEVRRWTKEN